jgi:diacylglycerol kinase
MGFIFRRMNALSNAWSGIRLAAMEEDHVRIHLSAAVLVIFMGAWFSVTSLEWFMLLACIVLVITLELVNSAIERLCNVVMPEPHINIKYVKDVCAAAVLIASIFAVITGLIVFIPYFFG